MNPEKTARQIVSRYESFGIAVKLSLSEVVDGGKRLIFSVKPKPGTKVQQIFDREKDIRIGLKLPLFQLSWEGDSILLAVSDRPVTENSLLNMLASREFRSSRMKLPLALGYDMRGRMFFADLANLVHVMYGGATGSGKTVGLQSLVMSLAAQPLQLVNLVIIDVYTSKLKLFNPLPHMVLPVVDELNEAVRVLQALVREMERRLKLPIEEVRASPALVCVIDEYINLVKKAGKAEEPLTTALESLLRLGRQAKIHVVLATQEPSKSSMKISLNNVSGRMAFSCSSVYGSLAILGCKGAEMLPKKGAMYVGLSGQTPVRLQGAAMSPDEIAKWVSCIASLRQDVSSKFNIGCTDTVQSLSETVDVLSDCELLHQADPYNCELAEVVIWALGQSTVSAEKIKFQFSMGNRAYDIVDKLCDLKLISEKFANQPRTVLPTCADDVPPEVLELLKRCDVNDEDVASAISSRG